MSDYEYMRMAVAEAQTAAKIDEVPVGSVIVAKSGEIISSAHNMREISKNALHHAEIIAIDAACRKIGGWRLAGCTIYVTLEPCPMCAGAIVNARIPRVVFGAKDPKGGAFGSVLNLNSYPLNFKPEIVPGILSEECAEILRHYFERKRALARRSEP